MMIELSRRISSEDDIRRLSVNGLGVQAHIVDNCIRQSQNRKYPDMSCAMYDVLKTWYITHCSRTQADTNLCIAVRKVHMDFLIKVLERKGHNGGYSRPEIDSKLMSIEISRCNGFLHHKYCLKVRIPNGTPNQYF